MAKEIKREIIKARDVQPASEAKEERKVERAAEEETEERKPKAEKAEKAEKTPKQKSTGKRILAIVFWLLAIACEAAVIMLLNGYLYIPGNPTTNMIIGIALDLVFVIIGSQIWKKANRLNPPSEKNKVAFFLCSQMGLIAAIIAFCPLIVLLLKNKDLDKKTKRIVTVIAVIACLIAGACSIDYDPPSAESLAEAKAEAAADGNFDGDVYWTRYGRSYHYDQDCHTLTRSSVLYEGTLDEAFDAKRTDPCDFCADGGEVAASSDAADVVGDIAEQLLDGEEDLEIVE